MYAHSLHPANLLMH